MSKTNKELAEQLGTTSRQITKSRKRGWLWFEGLKFKYKATDPVHFYINSKGKRIYNDNH